MLGVSDPYWIFQPNPSLNPSTGQPGSLFDPVHLADLGAYTNGDSLYLESGINNLFGLPFESALVDTPGWHYDMMGDLEDASLTTLNPGDSVSLTNVSTLYSQTADPDLSLVNYYFSPVSALGTDLVGDFSPVQPYPIPSDVGFDNTNQTGVMITSVGTPTLIGGWAKFAIANGNPNKFAYLGQYYETNAFVITNGILTTNTTGVVSPYGDFFPTEPGTVAMITMPDIDTGAQGTGVVRVVSINTDANHDGTMDFSFTGPDQTSPSRPFRFWVNDNQDSGDYGGNGGIPGLTGSTADGNNYQELDYPFTHNLFDNMVTLGNLK